MPKARAGTSRVPRRKQKKKRKKSQPSGGYRVLLDRKKQARASGKAIEPVKLADGSETEWMAARSTMELSGWPFSVIAWCFDSPHNRLSESITSIGLLSIHESSTRDKMGREGNTSKKKKLTKASAIDAVDFCRTNGCVCVFQ